MQRASSDPSADPDPRPRLLKLHVMYDILPIYHGGCRRGMAGRRRRRRRGGGAARSLPRPKLVPQLPTPPLQPVQTIPDANAKTDPTPPAGTDPNAPNKTPAGRPVLSPIVRIPLRRPLLVPLLRPALIPLRRLNVTDPTAPAGTERPGQWDQRMPV